VCGWEWECTSVGGTGGGVYRAVYRNFATCGGENLGYEKKRGVNMRLGVVVLLYPTLAMLANS
jgi:hypothetical protein